MGLLGRLAFYPSLVYNMAMEQLASRPWYSHIDNTVILGALPFKSMTKMVRDLFMATHSVHYWENFFLREMEGGVPRLPPPPDKQTSNCKIQNLKLKVFPKMNTVGSHNV